MGGGRSETSGQGTCPHAPADVTCPPHVLAQWWSSLPGASAVMGDSPSPGATHSVWGQLLSIAVASGLLPVGPSGFTP